MAAKKSKSRKPAKKGKPKKPAKKGKSKKTAKKGKSTGKKAPSLAKAVDALDHGHPALPTLLDAWRKTPSATLGAVIEYYAPSDDEVGRAVAGLAGRPGSKKLIKRVVDLARCEPDPRIASTLAGLVGKPPYTAQTMKPMWTSLFEQLTERHVDPRNLERLRAVRIEQTFGSTNMARWMAESLEEVIEALEARFAEGLPRHPEDKKLAGFLPQEEKPTPPPETKKREKGGGRASTEEQLLAEIADNPDDDAPRLVYADLVAEQGEAARAELINLQVRRTASGEPDPREEKLIRKHAAKWLAPIVPVLKKNDWTFERGFLHSCTVYPRKGNALELAGHPLWATVREVQLSETGDPAPVIVHPVMRNLRKVTLWSYPRGLAGLLDSDAPVEELHGVYVPFVKRDKDLWRAFVDCERLPRLRLVQMEDARPEDARALWSGGLARKGMRLVFGTHGHALSMLWTALLTSGPRTGPEVIVATQYNEFRVDRRKRTLLCTLSSRGPAEGLWDVGLGFKIVGGSGPGDGVTKDQYERIVLRLPEGGIKGTPTIPHPFKTSKDLLAAIKKRCKQLGAELSIEEGQWEMAYVKHNPLRL